MNNYSYISYVWKTNELQRLTKEAGKKKSNTITPTKKKLIFWSTLGPDIDKGLYIAQVEFYSQSFRACSLKSCIEVSIYRLSRKKIT